jgi:hypothetical protein
VAALVFAASLAHLVATPRLAGWGWDALVGAGGPLDRFVARTQSVDVVETVATGGAAGLDIGGVLMFGFVFDAGDVEPSIAAGVAPSRSDEIALGPATMRRLRVGIGDTVPITFGNQETGETGAKDVPLRVVGRSVTPNFFFSTQAPGEGAVVSPEAARRYIPDYTTDFLYVRFRPEVSVDDGIQRLNAALGQTFLIPRRQSS